MYTKEPHLFKPDYWHILTPEGDEICTVRGESCADSLLSHLNRY